MLASLRILAFPIACALTGAGAGLLTVQLATPPAAEPCAHGPVVELKNVATAMAAALPPPPPAAAPEPEPPHFRPLDPGAVRCRVDNDFVVDRAVIAALFDTPDQFSGHGRLLPSYQDDELQGFKIYAIRPGSLPKMIGLRNGDTLTALNGAPLTRSFPRKDVLDRLPTADTIDIDLIRKGKPLRIHLAVVGPK